LGKSDGKTEKATPRKKEQARKEGQIAKSQEVGVALSLVAAAVAARAFAPAGFTTIGRETRMLFTSAGSDALTQDAMLGSALKMASALALPFLAAATLAAVVAGVAQVGFKLTPKAAKPKLSHISPKSGLKRLKPQQAGWELVRIVTKLGLLALIVVAPIRAWAGQMTSARNLDSGLQRLSQQAFSIVTRAVLLALLIAAADYAWNRRKTARELRMSKYDVKKEHKDSEGDPLIRMQRRRRAHELSRNRMLRDVALADVVVTNPTHLAVALRYAEGDAAPKIVAKGADKIAAKIRAEAYRNGVVVTEDKPLARALYRRCKVGQHVPAALYEAVAVVLALAYRRYGKVAA
jgi:flagellar biosynthesis protein FlhB